MVRIANQILGEKIDGKYIHLEIYTSDNRDSFSISTIIFGYIYFNGKNNWNRYLNANTKN